MKKIPLTTTSKRILADVFTPVGIYLRLRDRFRDTILLESTDHHAAENSYSFICVNAIGGIEITDAGRLELKYPSLNPEKVNIRDKTEVPDLVWNFMQRFEVGITTKEAAFAQGLYGYTTYDAIQFFETIKIGESKKEENQTSYIPLMRYRLYQYVIAINHFRDELFICENHVAGIESELDVLESLIISKDVPVYPFWRYGKEESNIGDDDYKEMVRKGIQNCYRGDVFQIVLSRRFTQSFRGDEFNVYRALRSINPSPYLFYFDFGDYRLIGSSPEAQLVIKDGKAIVHPIAGTYKRSGDDEIDEREAARLMKDDKENAEHVMLVDLARNDLSRVCDDVRVTQFKEVQYYSHVIHLVSEVAGKVKDESNPVRVMAGSFPAGTLSGAPKFRAMELIEQYEPTSRGFYGGAIGVFGFDGSCNHAIMIRTVLSKSNKLIYQAGAGIVAASKPEKELEEVNNKVNALRKAIEEADENSY